MHAELETPNGMPRNSPVFYIMNVLLVAVGWGTGENVDVGGEHPCIQKTKNGGIVHRRRAKRWVCHTDSHVIHGVAFCSMATDPEAPF